MAEAKRHSFSQLFIWGTARGQFWGTIVQALALANSFFIVAALSVYQFGLYQLVLAVIAIADAFVTGLFDDIVISDVSRHFADGRRPEAKRLFVQFAQAKIGLAIAAFLVLFFAANLIAAHYDKDIGSLVRIAGALLLLGALKSVLLLFFRAAVSLIAFSTAAMQEIARFAFLIFFWQWGTLGIAEALWAGVLATAVVLVWVAFLFLREHRRIFRGVRAVADRLLMELLKRYGVLVLFRYAFSKATKQLDLWLVQIFLKTEAVALYALATNLVVIVQGFVPTGMSATLLPREVDDERRFGYLYRRGAKYAFWAGALIAAAAALAVPVAVWLAIPKYLPAVPLFLLFLLTTPLYGIYKFQKAVLVVLREQKLLTVRIFSERIVTAGILAVLLPLIGLTAAAVELLVTYGGRVALFSIGMNRRYPAWRLKLRHLFTFDADDRLFIGRIFTELRHPRRWFRPVRLT